VNVSRHGKTELDKKPACPDCLRWTTEFQHAAAGDRSIRLREREKLSAIAAVEIVQNDGAVTV
jgi:hypothetical protein